MYFHSGEKGSPGEVRIFPGDPGQKGDKGLSGNPGPEGEAGVCQGVSCPVEGLLTGKPTSFNQLQFHLV